jgi:hypothetical protein
MPCHSAHGEECTSAVASLRQLVAPGSNTRPAWRRLAALLLAAGLALTARADRAADVARIHLEAIGGSERIAALKSMRATGHVVASGRQVRFSFAAARPDRVRLETDSGGRTLVQGSDGVEAPWEFDTGTWPPQYRAMPEASARTFMADAEFDDPLVAGAARGFTLDYAGELEMDGRKLLRVLVTRKLVQTFSLLLDENTYFIVMRLEERPTVSGRKVQVVTHYDDFRPVDGVLLPHQVTVAIDGRVTQQTKISQIEANPVLKDDIFSRPKTAPPAAPKG